MSLILSDKRVNVFILAAIFLTASCSPYSPPTIEPSDAAFNGLSDYSASRLFMVHGMCHHNRKWFVGNVEHFKQKYEMQGGEISYVPLDEGLGVKLYTAELYTNEASVRLYGLIFSGITKEIKQKMLCANVSTKNNICENEDELYKKEQALINKLVKNELMNNCLADAVIYLGETGVKIRDGVRHALIAAHKHSDSFAKYMDTPLFYYSESLGSKILADSIVCSNPKDRKFLDKVMGATTLFVMAANQIPLLNLGNNKVPCTYSDNQKLRPMKKLVTYRDLFRFIAGSKKSNKDKERLISFSTPLTVLSFTDPNDILSYELSKSNIGKVNLVNITVSNASTLLFAYEDPFAAHTAYDSNKYFLELLWKGR